MTAISPPRSLVDRRALCAAVPLELAIIAFLLLAFPIFSFWVGLEALLILLGGYAFSWLFAFGILALQGRCERFPWMLWLVVCVARGAMPMGMFWVGDLWAARIDADVASGAIDPLFYVMDVPSIFYWGGSIWALIGGIAYGSSWERRQLDAGGTRTSSTQRPRKVYDAGILARVAVTECILLVSLLVLLFVIQSDGIHVALFLGCAAYVLFAVSCGWALAIPVLARVGRRAQIPQRVQFGVGLLRWVMLVAPFPGFVNKLTYLDASPAFVLASIPVVTWGQLRYAEAWTVKLREAKLA